MARPSPSPPTTWLWPNRIATGHAPHQNKEFDSCPCCAHKTKKKPPQPGKLKMFGRLGHLGHLTPKPQQNRPFFNLANMANPKTLAILPLAATPSSQLLAPAATAAVTPVSRLPSRGPQPAPDSFLLTPKLLTKKKLVDLVDLDNLARSPQPPTPAHPARANVASLAAKRYPRSSCGVSTGSTTKGQLCSRIYRVWENWEIPR